MCLTVSCIINNYEFPLPLINYLSDATYRFQIKRDGSNNMVSGNCWFFIWRFLGRPLIGPASCVLTAFSTFVKPSNKLLVWATQLFLCGNFLSAYWDPCEPKTTWNSHSAPEKEDNNPSGDHGVLLAANEVCHACVLSIDEYGVIILVDGQNGPTSWKL